MANAAIPALAVGLCQIWWAHASAAADPLLALLADDERGRHAGFLRAQDRALFLVSHALARIVVAHHAGAAPPMVLLGPGTPGAKPGLAGAAAGLELSISHSGRRAVVALSRGVALGVDVERVGAGGEDGLVESALDRAERAALASLDPPTRPWALARYWTRKEAVLKATGHGLAVSPKLIGVSAPTAAPALTRWTGPGRPAASIHLYDLDPGLGYAAALATIAGPLVLTEHDGSAILRSWGRGGTRVARRAGPRRRTGERPCPCPR
ncbi:MAG TPA: 4'-phosphopantetheinyl transferase superfamily protein [Solirubrobacteraceae bacterium]|nr:4'-phosphopantetheinyl transferase superfamily protein [Solirubrobacteraceae bacterium]